MSDRSRVAPLSALRSAARPSLEVLRSPQVSRLLGSALLGRLPTGMAALAFVHLVRGHGGSYTLAGTLTGAFAISSAIGRPVLARAVDRNRQTPVLAVAAVGAAAAFMALAATDPTASARLAIGAVIVAGLLQPPLEPCLRALWPGVLGDERRVHAAYALDAASQELIFVCGPLVVLASIAIAGPPGGLVAAALVGLAGTSAFATSAASRRWRAGLAQERHWAGPLRSVAIVRLMVALLLVGSGVGLFTVAITAYAEGHGVSVAGGWLIAANAFGALLGGVAYTAVRTTQDQAGRLPVLVGLLLLGYLPLAVYPPVLGMAPLAVLSGVFLAPTLACTFVVVDQLAPRGTVTEAFGWVETAFGVGYASGSALAGVLVDRAGDRVALSACAVVMAVALGLVVRRLAPARRVGKDGAGSDSSGGASGVI